MSVESKIARISDELHKTGLGAPNPKKIDKNQNKKSVAESWEDDASDGENAEDDRNSTPSEKSATLEAPGPTHLASPATRAADAERDLESSTMLDLPQVPPPTPISPHLTGVKPIWSPAKGLDGSRPAPSSASGYSSPQSTNNPTPRHGTPDITERDSSERRRPEKTTATANRLIAGALGIKAPPKTEEQKRYDRAIKEQEIKRKNREKEQKAKEAEEEEKAKAAIWDS